jgi:hypothetical protein
MVSWLMYLLTYSILNTCVKCARGMLLFCGFIVYMLGTASASPFYFTSWRFPGTLLQLFWFSFPFPNSGVLDSRLRFPSYLFPICLIRPHPGPIFSVIFMLALYWKRFLVPPGQIPTSCCGPRHLQFYVLVRIDMSTSFVWVFCYLGLMERTLQDRLPFPEYGIRVQSRLIIFLIKAPPYMWINTGSCADHSMVKATEAQCSATVASTLTPTLSVHTATSESGHVTGCISTQGSDTNCAGDCGWMKYNHGGTQNCGYNSRWCLCAALNI